MGKFKVVLLLPEGLIFLAMSKPEISITPAEEVTQAAGWLRTQLRAFNEQFLGVHQPTPIACVAKVDGEMVGGMLGTVVLDWLAVDIVYIEEAYRGTGLGTQLLMDLEAEGRRLGAKRAFVDTTSFQAEGFYTKFGYVEWGRFTDFAPGIDRIFLRKDKL